MGTWRPTRPSQAERIRDIPELCQENFKAIEDIIGTEHETFTDAASGKHKTAGIVKRGTTAEISSLSSPPTGAVGFDTDLGLFVYFNGLVWKYFGQENWSRSRSYASSAQAITADSGPIVVAYDTESFDTLDEFNTTTNTFTAKASGSYAIVAAIAVAASATIPALTAVCSATSTAASAWSKYNAATNLDAIDDYPTPDDTTYNIANVLDRTDRFGGTISPQLEDGALTAEVRVKFRGRASGCDCNITCYQHTCTCHSGQHGWYCACYEECYEYRCSCDMLCYHFVCFCNAMCYGDWDFTTNDCTCYVECNVFSCTCNSEEYGYFCSCDDTEYGTYCDCNYECYEEAWTCKSTCYAHDAAKPAAIITIGGTAYAGTTTTLASSWDNYEQLWSTNPSTGLAWAASEVNNIQDFGYKLAAASATTGASASISQAYLHATWYYHLRPVITLGLYKNGELVEAAYVPTHEAGAVSNQTIQLVTVLQLEPGDALQVQVSKTINNDTTIANSRYSYFTIHRLGGVCL